MLTGIAERLASSPSTLHGAELLVATQLALWFAFGLAKERLTRLVLTGAIWVAVFAMPIWAVCEIAIGLFARPLWSSGILVELLTGFLVLALPLKPPRPKTAELSDVELRAMAISTRTSRVVMGTMLISVALLALVT